MKEMIVYGCDFCKKSYKSKSKCKSHEKVCFHNAYTKSCATCGYLVFVPEDVPGSSCTFITKPMCLHGIIEETGGLRTNCQSWVDFNLVTISDLTKICESRNITIPNEILKKLIERDGEILYDGTVTSKEMAKISVC